MAPTGLLSKARRYLRPVMERRLATAHLPGLISTIVSRGGRPDLAAGALGNVDAPTLLIVGGLDEVVLGLNRRRWTN